jgi:hypothetical protein
VLDAFKTAFGERGDCSVSDHSGTGCSIAVIVIVDSHGRGDRVKGGRGGRGGRSTAGSSTESCNLSSIDILQTFSM